MPLSGYAQYVLEQLGPVGDISSRSMFGGVGIYSDGLFFALIGNDQLYFKVDDSNRPDFEEVDMGPFRPYGDERSMQYYEVPVDVLEDQDQLKVWAAKAVGVARNAKKGEKKR